jgi:hypothetical protein
VHGFHAKPSILGEHSAAELDAERAVLAVYRPLRIIRNRCSCIASKKHARWPTANAWSRPEQETSIRFAASNRHTGVGSNQQQIAWVSLRLYYSARSAISC